MSPTEVRPGEVALARDPSERADATLHFIGRIRSPWARGNCPRNIRAAREQGGAGRIELDPAFAPALTGLKVGDAIIVLYWMDDARRDLVVQAPKHAETPRGTFALRSPVRPNPVSLAVVRITAIDPAAATLGIDAIDCFDGTPLVDIKPWIETVDIPPANA